MRRDTDMWIDTLVLVFGLIVEFACALVVYRLAGFKVHKFDAVAFGLALLFAAWTIALITDCADERTVLVQGVGVRLCEICAALCLLIGYKKYKYKN